MLAELRIRDLAIIDALDLAFGPGLNVLTRARRARANQSSSTP